MRLGVLFKSCGNFFLSRQLIGVKLQVPACPPWVLVPALAQFPAAPSSWVTCHSVLRAFGAQEFLHTCDAFLSGPLFTVFSTLPAPRSPEKARAAVSPLGTPSVAQPWERGRNRRAEGCSLQPGEENQQGAFSTLSILWGFSFCFSGRKRRACLGAVFVQDLCCLWIQTRRLGGQRPQQPTARPCGRDFWFRNQSVWFCLLFRVPRKPDCGFSPRVSTAVSEREGVNCADSILLGTRAF